MCKKLVFVYLAIVFILVLTIEAKGGRGGGGRSGGRSSSKSSSSRRGSTSSISSSSSFGRSYTGAYSNGGWFHGFFHSTPYRYTYRPTYISSSHSSASSYRSPKEEENFNQDTVSYATVYSISRALNGDFYSIFNVVHDISKYPEKIKNREFLSTTTTEGPVSIYNENDVINPSYTKSSSTNVPNPFFLDDNNLFDRNTFKTLLSYDNYLKKQLNELLYDSSHRETSFQKPNEENSTAKMLLERPYKKLINELLYGFSNTQPNSEEPNKKGIITKIFPENDDRI